jgi:hypothetical protein
MEDNGIGVSHPSQYVNEIFVKIKSNFQICDFPNFILVVFVDLISNETSGVDTEEVRTGSEGHAGGNSQIVNNDLRKRPFDLAFTERTNHDLPSNKESRTEPNKTATAIS